MANDDGENEVFPIQVSISSLIVISVSVLIVIRTALAEPPDQHKIFIRFRGLRIPAPERQPACYLPGSLPVTSGNSNYPLPANHR